MAKEKGPIAKEVRRQVRINHKGILTHFKKLRNAILYGTYFGAALAVILGIMSEDLKVAALTTLVGIGYMGLFTWINRDDRIFQ